MGCPALTIYDYFRVEYPEYDPAGQLTSAKKFFSDNTQDFSYNYGFNYDPAGNSLKRISQGQERNYTFNNLNQFTSASSPDKMDVTGSVSPTIVNPSITVNGELGTVNENGMWAKQSVPLTQGENTIIVSAKDMFDREKTETRKVTLLPPPVFTYDANGNMTSDGLWNYSWNDENRMISASSAPSAVKVENVYDGIGRRRIKKAFDNGILKSEIRFVYDGVYIIAETDGNGNLLRRYVRNGDQLLAVEDIALGKTFYYCTDGNKNVTDLVDAASGEAVGHYEYDPFGRITTQSGSYADTNPFRFSSEYFDKETGLIAFLYRDYSPEYTRWMSRDPIEEAGGINLYHYCNNDPINIFDKFGLDAEDVYRRSSFLKEELGDVETSKCVVNSASDLAAWNAEMERLQGITEEWKQAGMALGEFLIRAGFEPADWAGIVKDAINKDLHPSDLLGLAPFIPAGISKLDKVKRLAAIDRAMEAKKAMKTSEKILSKSELARLKKLEEAQKIKDIERIGKINETITDVDKILAGEKVPDTLKGKILYELRKVTELFDSFRN